MVLARCTQKAGGSYMKAIWAGVLAAAGFGLAGATVMAQSLNLYGQPGLIDMPSGEARSDGEIGFTYGRFEGTSRTSVDFQIGTRVGATLRYSAINSFGAGGESRDDEQIDFRLLLVKETDTLPAVTLGIRDFLGNGTYSSEYLAATKEVIPGLRVTGGLGWGRLAGEAAFDNPFGGTRSREASDIFDVNDGNFFRGADLGVFGGVAYTPEGSSWTFKAEYSSDAYTAEGAGGDFAPESPWNFGIERRLGAGVDLGVYAMGAEAAALRLSFSADPRVARVPQDFAGAPGPFIRRPEGGKRGTKWMQNDALKGQILGALIPAFEAEGMRLEAISFEGNAAEVRVTNLAHSRPSKAVGRAARLMSSGLPPSVEEMRITVLENGLPAATVVVPRSQMERLIYTHEAAPESWQHFAIRSPGAFVPDWEREETDRFDWAIVPRVPFSVFGGGFDFDVRLGLEATYRVAPGLSFSGEVSQSLLGRLDGSVSPGTSLPAVRSNYAQYQKDTPVLERMTGDWTGALAPGVYGRVSAGYLERMYGGVSGELLYKDTASPLAYGLEMNWAKQRDPDDAFGFADHDAVTGFASLYWDTGWNGMHTQVDAGRYLAGDWGATVTVSRRFENGWEVAGYVTATDGDTAGLPSGDFDHGVRLTVPLQWTWPAPTRRKITVPFRTLGRDAGARLDLEDRLYPMLRDVDRQRLHETWSAFWQ